MSELGNVALDRCDALDWDKAHRDYTGCAVGEATKRLRILGLVTVDVTLCATHRRVFEEELARFDGCLDRRRKIVEVVPPRKRNRKLRKGSLA